MVKRFITCDKLCFRVWPQNAKKDRIEFIINKAMILRTLISRDFFMKEPLFWPFYVIGST